MQNKQILSDTLNMGVTYVCEQLLTACAPVYLFALNKLNKRFEEKCLTNTKPLEEALTESTISDDELRRADNAALVGGLVGLAQDIVFAAGSFMYLSGNHGRFATIAAAITGAKIIGNVVGLAGMGIYRLATRNTDDSLQQSV